MFEYHEPNLTVDADGVSVTVALAEPLDIEKPLADLDLTSAKPIQTKQEVVTTWDIAELEQDLDGNRDRAEIDDEDDWGRDEFRWMRGHPINGFNPSSYEPRQYHYPDEREEDYEIGGGGNEQVLARAIPYLELGVRGLLAWCTRESHELAEFKQWAEVRSREVKAENEARWAAERQAQKEKEEREAAELERVMPKRDTSIAYKEFKHFIDEHLVELQPNGTYFWKEVGGKRLVFYQSLGGVSFEDENGEYLSTDREIKFSQEFTSEKWNDHTGEVAVSDRGYFTAVKRSSLDDLYYTDGFSRQDFPSVEQALESLIPFVLEGERDSSFGLLDSTVRGTEFSDEEDL